MCYIQHRNSMPTRWIGSPQLWMEGYWRETRTMFASNQWVLMELPFVQLLFGSSVDKLVKSFLAEGRFIQVCLFGRNPANKHGLTIGAPGMSNVGFSMEHQSILWCNQLAVQVAHILFQLVDKRTGQPFDSPQMRLAVFVAKLTSALPQVFEWLPTNQRRTNTLALLEKTEAAEDCKTRHMLRIEIALGKFHRSCRHTSVSILFPVFMHLLGGRTTETSYRRC